MGCGDPTGSIGYSNSMRCGDATGHGNPMCCAKSSSNPVCCCDAMGSGAAIVAGRLGHTILTAEMDLSSTAWRLVLAMGALCAGMARAVCAAFAARFISAASARREPAAGTVRDDARRLPKHAGWVVVRG